MSAPAETIARANPPWRYLPLRGEYVCSCPVPTHGKGQGDRSPSLRVADGDVAPVFTCYADCERADIAAELRRQGLLDGGRASTSNLGEKPTRSPPPEIEPNSDALRIWRGSVPIEQSDLGRRYLGNVRRIPPPYSPALRFSESERHPPSGRRFPALVAAVALPTRRVVAVQLTFIDPNTGNKASVERPRWGIGSYHNGAVRLAPVTDTLGIAEGTETAMSAQLISGVPTWAALSAERLHRVAIPASVRELHLFADDDDAGRRAAERAADLNRHLQVEIRLPPSGHGDWNDVLTRKAAAA